MASFSWVGSERTDPRSVAVTTVRSMVGPTELRSSSVMPSSRAATGMGRASSR